MILLFCLQFFWQTNFGNNSNAVKFVNDNEAIYIIANQNDSTLLAKVSNNGNLIWQHLFNGISSDIVLHNSKIYISSHILVNQQYDLQLSCFKDGKLLWKQIHGSNWEDISEKVFVKDDNIYVLGMERTIHQIIPDKDVALIKFDLNGNILNVSKFDYRQNDDVPVNFLINENDIYIIATCYSIQTLDDVILLRYTNGYFDYQIFNNGNDRAITIKNYDNDIFVMGNTFIAKITYPQWFTFISQNYIPKDFYVFDKIYVAYNSLSNNCGLLIYDLNGIYNYSSFIGYGQVVNIISKQICGYLWQNNINKIFLASYDSLGINCISTYNNSGSYWDLPHYNDEKYILSTSNFGGYNCVSINKYDKILNINNNEIINKNNNEKYYDILGREVLKNYKGIKFKK